MPVDPGRSTGVGQRTGPSANSTAPCPTPARTILGHDHVQVRADCRRASAASSGTGARPTPGRGSANVHRTQVAALHGRPAHPLAWRVADGSTQVELDPFSRHRRNTCQNGEPLRLEHCRRHTNSISTPRVVAVQARTTCQVGHRHAVGSEPTGLGRNTTQPWRIWSPGCVEVAILSPESYRSGSGRDNSGGTRSPGGAFMPHDKVTNQEAWLDQSDLQNVWVRPAQELRARHGQRRAAR